MNITYPLNSFSRDDIAAVNYACIGDCVFHKKTGQYGSFQLVGTSLAPGACMLAGRYWETDSYTPIDLAAVEGNAYIKIRLDTTQQNYGFSVVCESATATSGNGVYEMDLYAVTVTSGIISASEKLYKESDSLGGCYVPRTGTYAYNEAVTTSSTSDMYYMAAGDIVVIQGKITITAVYEDVYESFNVSFDYLPSEYQNTNELRAICLVDYAANTDKSRMQLVRFRNNNLTIYGQYDVGDVIWLTLVYPRH